MAKTATFVGMLQRSTRELATNHADGGGARPSPVQRHHRPGDERYARALRGTSLRAALLAA
jgi:hypothetical protein